MLMNNKFKAQSLNRKSYRKFTLSWFSVTCFKHFGLLWPISALDRKQVRGYIKISSYQYRDPHVKDKTVLRPLSLTWESPYLGKTVFILRGALIVGWADSLRAGHSLHNFHHIRYDNTIIVTTCKYLCLMYRSPCRDVASECPKGAAPLGNVPTPPGKFVHHIFQGNFKHPTDSLAI